MDYLQTRYKKSPKRWNETYLVFINYFLQIACFFSGGSNDITCYEDIETFRKKTNASSVMVARAAQLNCSVFRKEGPLPMDQVVEDYMKLVRN